MIFFIAKTLKSIKYEKVDIFVRFFLIGWTHFDGISTLPHLSPLSLLFTMEPYWILQNSFPFLKSEIRIEV
jgi:hypothetical protein